MSKTSPISGFWNYVAECLRLLYWVYFKPFTFERWLRDIHPELKPTDNPFKKQAEFHTNPRLRRYAGQFWWLTELASIFSLLLIGPAYKFASGESFNWWFLGSIFWLGWLIGKFLKRGINTKKFLFFGDDLYLKNFSFIIYIFWIAMFAIKFLSGVPQDVAVGMLLGVLERGVQYFRELWTSLAESDRNLLRRIIHGETPTPQDKGVVRKLARKEILTQEGNAFQVPLVQKYIEQLLEEE
ncbi:MAG: hypothetical protein V7K41_11555 [Nostoc sp.]|uniref:hypothetical protein n=1 Tax=Nostoc sp. TaxID=1180 RepID=UPI002FF4830C